MGKQMAKLVLSMDGLVLKEIPLTRERTSIGRKPHNDIQIDNLAISGEHAVIVTVLNDSFLEDLNSTNGTYVNGQPIKKHFLQNNDVVELGKYRIKYLTEPLVSNPATEYEKTVILTPEDLRRPAGEAPAPAQKTDAVATEPTLPASVKALPVGVLQILNGANAGRELILSKTLTTLGKPGGQVAVITRRPQGYYITHVEGEQFPVLNGRTLDTQAHPLTDHDVIQLAGVKMEFFLRA
jgi:pSer/pThr/pTyr-binding forkhead associated (FHA) protein